jgi:hypothetical protein
MAQSVPLLDLTARTSAWLTEVGPNGWQPLHALGTDVTHTNDAGAAVEAGFVRDLIVQANLTELMVRIVVTDDGHERRAVHARGIERHHLLQTICGANNRRYS